MQIQKFNQTTAQRVASRTLFLEQNFAQKSQSSYQEKKETPQDYTVGAKVNSSGAYKSKITLMPLKAFLECS